jgi:hypothetical protein
VSGRDRMGRSSARRVLLGVESSSFLRVVRGGRGVLGVVGRGVLRFGVSIDLRTGQ